MENKTWFERIFSIDELKFSGLTLVLFVLVGFGCYSLLVKGDVPSNLTALIEICIGAIAGVNAFSFVGNSFGMNKTQNGMIPMQNQYGNQYSQYGTSNMGMNGYQNNGYMNNSMGMNQPMNNMNGIPNNNIVSQAHNLSDPPVQQMPIVNNQNSGVKSPV